MNCTVRYLTLTFLALVTPLCKTLGGSSRLAADPAIFCWNDRLSKVDDISNV